MGNHQAGLAMGRTAEALLSNRTSLSALELLDIIYEPYRGCDAEFGAEDPAKPGYDHPVYIHYTDPDGPIGQLIIEAFGGDRDWKTEFEAVNNETATMEEYQQFEESWWGEYSCSKTDRIGSYDGPYGKFRKRYEFC